MNQDHKFPPQELMLIPRWIVSDKNKKPIPGTAAAASDQWMNYDAALAKLEELPDAVHLGLTLFNEPTLGPERLLVLDLDSCIDDKGIQPWAQVIVDHCDSYTEKSPSGTGLHIFVRVPADAADYPGGKAFIDVPFEGDKQPQIQVIGGAANGYVIVTGDMIEGVQDRVARVPDLDWLRKTYPPGSGEKKAEQLETGMVKDTDQLTDEQIIERLSINAAVRLGNWKSGDYKSASEAYWRLVHEVLHACRRDGERTIEFLLGPACGLWAAGAVESVDPGKFAKREWVENNVLRATGKTEGERAEFGVEEESEPTGDEATDLGLLRPSGFRRRFAQGSPFLIDDFLPSQGVVQIYGREKHGKSLWAMAIAYAVANPEVNTCFGMDVFEHGPVQVLVGEDQFGVSGRTRAQELLCKVGESMNMDETDIWLTVTPADLCTQEGLDRLLKQLEFTKPKMLIVDTQIANAGGIDENSTKDMAQLFRNCEAIAKKIKGVVLLIHHMAKSGSGGARGSGVQGGAVVADFQATRDGIHAKLQPRHAKNWIARKQLRGTIVSVEIGTKANGEPLTAPALDYRVDLVDVVTEMPDEQSPAQEIAEPQTPEGVRPEAELILWTMLHGVGRRPDIAAMMHEKGHISTPSPAALRKLEAALVKAQKLIVETKKGPGGGALYKPF